MRWISMIWENCPSLPNIHHKNSTAESEKPEGSNKLPRLVSIPRTSTAAIDLQTAYQDKICPNQHSPPIPFSNDLPSKELSRRCPFEWLCAMCLEHLVETMSKLVVGKRISQKTPMCAICPILWIPSSPLLAMHVQATAEMVWYPAQMPGCRESERPVGCRWLPMPHFL